MKKLVLTGIMFLLLFSLAVYSNEAFAEIKPLMEKVAMSLEKFISHLEKAENANDIVAALDNYASEVLPLAPKMKSLIKKYPELKELKDADIYPEELKPVMEKIEKLGERMLGGMAKIQQYANDPKVKEAQTRWLKAMGTLEALGEDENNGEEKKEDSEISNQLPI